MQMILRKTPLKFYSNLKDKSSFTYFYQSKAIESTALIVKHDTERVYPCHTSTEYVFQTQQPIPEWTRDLKMKWLKATGVFNFHLGQRFSLFLCRPNSMTRTNAQISKCRYVWQIWNWVEQNLPIIIAWLYCVHKTPTPRSLLIGLYESFKIKSSTIDVSLRTRKMNIKSDGKLVIPTSIAHGKSFLTYFLYSSRLETENSSGFSPDRPNLAFAPTFLFSSLWTRHAWRAWKD